MKYEWKDKNTHQGSTKLGVFLPTDPHFLRQRLAELWLRNINLLLQFMQLTHIKCSAGRLLVRARPINHNASPEDKIWNKLWIMNLKESQSLNECPFIWLNNSKFVTCISILNILYVAHFAVPWTLPPATPHHSSPPESKPQLINPHFPFTSQSTLPPEVHLWCPVSSLFIFVCKSSVSVSFPFCRGENRLTRLPWCPCPSWKVMAATVFIKSDMDLIRGLTIKFANSDGTSPHVPPNSHFLWHKTLYLLLVTPITYF